MANESAILSGKASGRTVGRDENAIREYIQKQEKEDQRLEQLNLWK